MYTESMSYTLDWNVQSRIWIHRNIDTWSRSCKGPVHRFSRYDLYWIFMWVMGLYPWRKPPSKGTQKRKQLLVGKNPGFLLTCATENGTSLAVYVYIVFSRARMKGKSFPSGSEGEAMSESRCIFPCAVLSGPRIKGRPH